MADELDPLFAPLRKVTALLTDPADVRATANRRTAIRRATLAGLGTAAVIAAVVVFASLSLRHNNSAPVLPGGSTAPSVAPSLAAPSSPAPSPSPSPSVVTAGSQACTPSKLDARPYYGSGGAAGHMIYTIAVHNVSGSPCTVTGPVVLLGVNERTGKQERIPLDNDGTGDPVTIRPRQWGYFSIQAINGQGGYEPGNPACANPRAYRDLVLVLDGKHFALRGFALSWQCGTAGANGWQTTADITPLGLQTRAP